MKMATYFKNMGAINMTAKKMGCFLIFVLLPIPAYSYLDGGTISMALQLIAGGVGLALLFMRQWFTTLINFFRRKNPDDENSKAAKKLK